VSLTVVFRETALRNLARIRGEVKDLFVRTRRPLPCWLISRIRRMRSRGAPQAAGAALHAAEPRAAVFPSPPARYMRCEPSARPCGGRADGAPVGASRERRIRMPGDWYPALPLLTPPNWLP